MASHAPFGTVAPIWPTPVSLRRPAASGPVRAAGPSRCQLVVRALIAASRRDRIGARRSNAIGPVRAESVVDVAFAEVLWFWARCVEEYGGEVE
jgi:hypothetical protein